MLECARIWVTVRPSDCMLQIRTALIVSGMTCATDRLTVFGTVCVGLLTNEFLPVGSFKLKVS